ncbi:MAG: IPTL-CTERM sorting domain-containing protein [Candidatus Latescibacteria bacterium]|nr:IPTL-CTERM sorting domain-containing protein [Candidatus Latescibacterota bacterium]NIO56271.1 IPTL-CTERM sorting domain-containing protein [Candidatus Latescibacterota bacterium]
MKKGTLIQISLVLAVAVALTMIPHVKADSQGSSLVRDTLVLYPTDDALIDANSPDQNWGSSNSVNVRNNYGSGGSCCWERCALTKFDISSLPENCTIVSATLNLYYYNCYANNCGDRVINCYRLVSDWGEGSVTYNTRPDTASNITSFSTVPLVYSWMDWVVTSDVEAFYSGSETNYGWQLMDEVYWGSANIPDEYFRSKEYGSNIPYLEIIYDRPEIPTLGQWGLIILFLLLVGAAAILIHRRRRAEAF